MELGLTTAVYIAAAVLFILSLGGLSGQESAKRAVWYGIFGMAFAIIATLVGPGNGLWWLSLGLIVAGVVFFVLPRFGISVMGVLQKAITFLPMIRGLLPF